MSDYPLPVDAYGNFDATFTNSDIPGPAALPVSNPTKAFWTHPGLSTDWPISISVAVELGKLVRQENVGDIKVVILEARDFCRSFTIRSVFNSIANCRLWRNWYEGSSMLKSINLIEKLFQDAMEKHTVSSLLNLIEEGGWAKDVDLIEGGHNELLASSDGVDEGRADWRKAVDAGIIKENDVTWFTPEEAKDVRPGHNLWPVRLVTKMFELARDGKNATESTPGVQSSQQSNNSSYSSTIARILSNILPSSSKSGAENQGTTRVGGKSNNQDPYRLILHTHTPAHSVKSNVQKSGRKWAVETSRGIVHTDTVVYATNAYASHLLPQLAGPKGIIPVRGQVVAVRALVGYIDEGWKEKGGVVGLTRSGWGGNQGFEYWFPRPNPSHPSATPTQNEEELPTDNTGPNKGIQRPLVILGGARETLKDKGYGMYETDDSKLDAEASAGLRRFLHSVFPGQYSTNDLESVSKNIEVEWVMLLKSDLVGRVKDANGTIVPGQYISAGYTGHALASLIWRDIKQPNKDWTIPDWLPRHYLTQSPEEYKAGQSD
ncbi:15055_t:CDS:2 [Acaulospora colombiana]|uniref:15055_t:CDS:1 n=1 Tax=Acaulospora colombiana TaxID=27376 RepID=A0ACA9MJX8_9GLOM|nr:15055_t:CDS:2 [Acaulospora colombiana]